MGGRSKRSQRWEGWLVNTLLALVCLMMLLPIATTVLISFKREQDVVRKPPVILPCDTPERNFDPRACRDSKFEIKRSQGQVAAQAE